MAARQLKTGDLVAKRYRIEGVLGQGGMGIVFAARHAELGHRVAIKVLSEEARKDVEHVERFLREARAAARLSSDHVAKVTDTGRLDDGTPFLVMEYLDGQDLGNLVARGPLAVADAVDYILQACEAVGEAHARGIVHRDLKPRNLFLTKRAHGQALVKVLDFGIAKVPSRGERALTAANTVMGSVQYMSPEQMRSALDTDARSDIWSLGVCLYELLTGAMPFDDVAMPGLCAKILIEEPVPVTHLRPDIPPALGLAILQCLEKKRELRFPSVVELAAALEPFGSPSSAGAPQRVRAVQEAVSSGELAPSVRPEPAGSEIRTVAVFETRGGRHSAVIPVIALASTAGIVLAIAAAFVLRAPRAADTSRTLAGPPTTTSSEQIEPVSSNASGIRDTLVDAAAVAMPVRPVKAATTPTRAAVPVATTHKTTRLDAGTNPSARY